MSIGVLLRGFIGDMMDFGDVILYTLFPSFMAIQACCKYSATQQQAPGVLHGLLVNISLY